MTNEVRARRLADRIKVIAAETLERRVKDPRLGFVTITDARVTGDLREASVFYTVLGEPEQRAASAEALTRVAGLVRSEVGAQTGIKFTPTITFVPDAVADTARHIDDLLAEAHAADEAVASAARQASYAGDADPYRRPAAVDEERDAGTGLGTGGLSAPTAADADGADPVPGRDR